jgi:hypothetical protein
VGSAYGVPPWQVAHLVAALLDSLASAAAKEKAQARLRPAEIDASTRQCLRARVKHDGLLLILDDCHEVRVSLA